MSDKKIALDVSELSVQYQEGLVLWDVSFSLLEGKLAAIIGPNGAGKSTLLKSLVGLIRSSSGKVRFFGHPFGKVRKKVAYVPQRSEVDWDFPITAFEVVLMGRYSKLGPLKWSRRVDKEAALDMMRRLEIDNLASRQISKLSGGQQQRLFLARALLQDADLYLFDEPFAGVDLMTEKMLIDIFKKLRDQGKTLIIVHHDLNTVEEIFDDVVLINKRLVASGPLKSAFTSENLAKAYGKRGAIFDEVVKLSQTKTQGTKL